MGILQGLNINFEFSTPKKAHPLWDRRVWGLRVKNCRLVWPVGRPF